MAMEKDCDLVSTLKGTEYISAIRGWKYGANIGCGAWKGISGINPYVL